MFSWLRKGASKPPESADRAADTTAEIVLDFPRRIVRPDRSVVVTVHAHTLQRMGQAIPCWTYYTEGLMQWGHKEIVFTLKRRPQEAVADFPGMPVTFLQFIEGVAKQGMTVSAGGCTWIGPKTPLLGFTEILYVDPLPQNDLPAPAAPHLRMLLLREIEFTAVKAFGFSRVLSRLGAAYRYYPFPEWEDLDRPALPLERTLQESLLSRMSGMRDVCSDAYCFIEQDGHITLRLTGTARKTLSAALAALPADTIFTIFTGRDPTATGWLVWEPGDQTPGGIIPPNGGNARMAGNFITFCPNDEDMATVKEDGFVVLISPASFASLRRAIEEGRQFSLVPVKGNRFSCY